MTLRSQHGPAITPADPELVARVMAKLSSLATAGESFTTPALGETRWAEAFAARAKLWNTANVVRLPEEMTGNACHDQSAGLAAAYPTHLRHVFGWAMDDSDTHWRTHSWVHDLDRDVIVETTPFIRVAHLGVELTPEESRGAYDETPGEAGERSSP